MIKHRSKIWALFLLVCIIAQLVTSVVGPAVISSVKQAIVEHETKLEAEQMQTTEPSESEEPNVNDDSVEMFGKLAGVMGNVSRYVGILIIVFGMFQFILAFKDDNPELTSRAIMLIVVGGALIGASAIIPKIVGGMT